MQQFNLDISAPRGPLVLYASQGDSLSRFFAVTVTDNGAAYEPPAGAIYTVRFGAPGMPAGWYDTITEVGGGTHPAVVVSGNTYTVELAEQVVSVPGTNAVVLIVSDATGYTLASWAFELDVAAVPGYDAPEATVYYNALSEQVAQTLTNAQAAAASATLAESWAVGGTGTRPGEDTNNAEYWASEAQRVSQGALGWYETEQALQAAHPIGTDGEWAIIGSTDTIWTWDSDTSAWVDSGAQMDLSNYYTKAQADAAFATAAQGALAASAVQTVNGSSGPAATVTTQNLEYQVGDTITSANGAFDPNVDIGGTWTSRQVKVSDVPVTQIQLSAGVSSTLATVCNFTVTNGICVATFYAVSCADNNTILTSNLPGSVYPIYYTTNTGKLVMVTMAGVEAINALSGESFTVVYPTFNADTLTIWTKTA